MLMLLLLLVSLSLLLLLPMLMLMLTLLLLLLLLFFFFLLFLFLLLWLFLDDTLFSNILRKQKKCIVSKTMPRKLALFDGACCSMMFHVFLLGISSRTLENECLNRAYPNANGYVLKPLSSQLSFSFEPPSNGTSLLAFAKFPEGIPERMGKRKLLVKSSQSSQNKEFWWT